MGSSAAVTSNVGARGGRPRAAARPGVPAERRLVPESGRPFRRPFRERDERPGAGHDHDHERGVEPRDGREDGDGDEEQDLEQEAWHGGPRRRRARDRAHPGARVPARGRVDLPARRVGLSGWERARGGAQGLKLGLKLTDLLGQRADGAEELRLRGRRARRHRRLARFRHALVLRVAGSHLVERRASLAVHLAPSRGHRRLRRGLLRPRPPSATSASFRRSSLAGSAIGASDAAGPSALRRRLRRWSSAAIPSVTASHVASFRMRRWYRRRKRA